MVRGKTYIAANMSDDNDDVDEQDYSFRKDAIEYAETVQKRGVIYISRIPPFMKPNKVRNCFEVYGEVTRLYLGTFIIHFSFF